MVAEAGRDDGKFGLALLLAGLAGWVDAAGLRDSGGVFLSFMSGNTTDLAVSLAHQDWVRAGIIAGVIASFVGGVVTGETIEPWGGSRGQSLVLGVEAVVLGGGALLHHPALPVPAMVTFMPLVFAMGLQNATMRRAGGINIGLTYVTGTLVQVGRALSPGGNRAHLSSYLALWFSLAIGSGLGAVTLSISMLMALSVACAVAAMLAVMALVVRG
jgi:uncharacterized membrane protein YoaK (UPF0700 family)